MNENIGDYKRVFTSLNS